MTEELETTQASENPYYGKARIYYSDGKWVEMENAGAAPELVKTGVIAIVQIVDGARRILSGRDYYWPMGAEWCGGDWHGCMMYLMEPGLKAVLFGINIPTHQYKHYMQQIDADETFPKVKHD